MTDVFVLVKSPSALQLAALHDPDVRVRVLCGRILELTKERDRLQGLVFKHRCAGCERFGDELRHCEQSPVYGYCEECWPAHAEECESPRAAAALREESRAKEDWYESRRLTGRSS